MLQLLVDLRGFVHWLELVFKGQVNLSLNKLIVNVFVTNVQKHIVELNEELLALLLHMEALFFLVLDGTLAFS